MTNDMEYTESIYKEFGAFERWKLEYDILLLSMIISCWSRSLQDLSENYIIDLHIDHGQVTCLNSSN